MLDELLKLNPQLVQVAKGELLQRAGQHPNSAYFVRKGLLRSYTLDNKGKEHIFMFASEGWIISDIESQVFGTPSDLYIDALENSDLLVFENNLALRDLSDADSLSQLLNTLFKRIAVMQRRILGLLSASAAERYEAFLSVYPELPHRVPQKMIASYLGITPEALSHIRRKIAQKA